MGTVSDITPKGRGKGRNAPVAVPLKPEDRFIKEYLIDRDPYAAAMRAGVRAINVKAKVKAWMGDPDILKRIQDATDSQDITEMVTPQRVMAGFLDVAFDKTAPQAARNAALRELAALTDMYPKKEDPDKNKKYARNVMIVPGTAALTDWEAAALQQQKKLKDEVRS